MQSDDHQDHRHRLSGHQHEDHERGPGPCGSEARVPISKPDAIQAKSTSSTIWRSALYRRS
jgi:hypothetical protein